MINLSNVNPPLEGIRMEEQNTLAYINDVCKGQGTLYIAESEIVWLSNSNEGFTLKYPDISVFAVCLDQEKYPENCIYMLAADENAEEEENSSDDEEDGYVHEVEIRFAPPSGTSFQDLFTCIQECNRLHDTSDASDDDSEENDMDDTQYEDENYDNSNMFFNGAGNTKNVNGQFDDAE